MRTLGFRSYGPCLAHLVGWQLPDFSEARNITVACRLHACSSNLTPVRPHLAFLFDWLMHLHSSALSRDSG